LSLAHLDQPKGEARATLATVAEHRGDLFYLTATDEEERLRATQEALGRDCVFSELHHHQRPEDTWVLEGRAAMARRCRAPVVATNAVHYHVRSAGGCTTCWSRSSTAAPLMRSARGSSPTQSTA